MKRVLFVCTGNICRSPTAEAFLGDLVRRGGFEDRIFSGSVGVADWHVGKPPDARAIESLRKRGVDMSHLRARQIHPDDYWRNDLILAMDHTHLNHLKLNSGPDAGDIRMFLESLGRTDDVPDPYYGGHGDFEHALDLIEEGCRAWFESVRKSMT